MAGKDTTNLRFDLTVRRIVALVSWLLAERAFAGLGPSSLAGPSGAEMPWNAFLKVKVC